MAGPAMIIAQIGKGIKNWGKGLSELKGGGGDAIRDQREESRSKSAATDTAPQIPVNTFKPLDKPTLDNPTLDLSGIQARNPLASLIPILGSRKKGGKIKKTGLYLLHSGEEVESASEVKNRNKNRDTSRSASRR